MKKSIVIVLTCLLIAAFLSCTADRSIRKEKEIDTAVISGKTSRAQNPPLPERLLFENKLPPARQIEIIRSLGNSRDPAAIQLLIDALDAPQVTEKWAAVQALGKTRNPRALQPLIALLDPKEPKELRADAIGALGNLGDPGAVDPLLQQLRKKNVHEQARITEALHAIGPEKVAAEIRQWIHDNPFKDTFYRRKGKDNVLYVPLGGIYALRPFYKNYATARFTLLPFFGKSDIQLKKPTHIIIGTFDENPAPEKPNQNPSEKITDLILTFHCIPTSRGEKSSLNWCGKTFKGTLQKNMSNEKEEKLVRSPWKDVPPLDTTGQ